MALAPLLEERHAALDRVLDLRPEREAGVAILVPDQVVLRSVALYHLTSPAGKKLGGSS
jgi:hypothetical protein